MRKYYTITNQLSKKKKKIVPISQYQIKFLICQTIFKHALYLDINYCKIFLFTFEINMNL